MRFLLEQKFIPGVKDVVNLTLQLCRPGDTNANKAKRYMARKINTLKSGHKERPTEHRGEQIIATAASHCLHKIQSGAGVLRAFDRLREITAERASEITFADPCERWRAAARWESISLFVW